MLGTACPSSTWPENLAGSGTPGSSVMTAPRFGEQPRLDKDRIEWCIIKGLPSVLWEVHLVKPGRVVDVTTGPRYGKQGL